MSASLVTCIAGCVAFSSFASGIRGHFDAGERMPPRMRLLTLIGTAAALVHLAAGLAVPRGALASGVAALMYIGAAALFFGAVRTSGRRTLRLAFSSGPPRALLAHGPYRFVRHPFYASYSIAWAAGLIASGSVWPALAVLPIAALYALAIRQEEAAFAAGPLAAEYRAYSSRAGALWPRVGALSSRR